jgi:hypothetical protein
MILNGTVGESGVEGIRKVVDGVQQYDVEMTINGVQVNVLKVAEFLQWCVERSAEHKAKKMVRERFKKIDDKFDEMEESLRDTSQVLEDARYKTAEELGINLDEGKKYDRHGEKQ